MMIKEEINKSKEKLNSELVTLLPKQDSKVYDQRLRLREDEIQVLYQYAQIMELSRHKAFVGVVRSIGEIQELSQSNFELNKIGVNLNQLHIAQIQLD